jgi:hypothetical protein
MKYCPPPLSLIEIKDYHKWKNHVRVVHETKNKSSNMKVGGGGLEKHCRMVTKLWSEQSGVPDEDKRFFLLRKSGLALLPAQEFIQ